MARRDFWQAEAQAAAVLAERMISALPVDPFEIATSAGIVCERLYGSGISDCLCGAGNTFGIFYNGSIASEGFRRFTVAHELGHYFLGGHYKHIFADGNSRHESNSGFSSDDPYEREADAFAAALLMPKDLLRAACALVQPGLRAVESLAEKCVTSITATAIRYAVLSDDPITVICSKDNRVQFAFMSETLKRRRDLTWIKKNSGIPDGTATSRFNKDPNNIAQCKRVKSSSPMDIWFDGGGTVRDIEEVVGLGNYRLTLTVSSRTMVARF